MSFESIEEAQDVFLDLFYEADLNENGVLTVDEFKAMLEKGGYFFTEEETKKHFASIDSDGDNSITLDEFLQAMTGVPLIDHRRATWRRAFALWDADQSRDISRAELRQVYRDVTGSELTEQQLEDAFRCLDKNQDGKICWQELASYLASLSKNVF